MANTKIVLNHKCMAELLKDAGVRADLTRRAERVKVEAQAGAPQHDMEIEQVTHDRAVVRVVNTSPDAVRYEADHGTLARALRAAGGA